MILAGALVMLSSSWSGSLMAFRKSQTLTTVAYLLKRKMTELEVKYRPETGLLPPEAEEGDFGSDYKDFRWKLMSKQVEFPDLSAALVSSRAEGTPEILISTLRQLSDQLSRNVREMTLVVYAKIGRRELEYSVTSYSVNYAGVTVGAGGSPR